MFQKLLVNFTWWLNREDADGNNVFGGGFLGLDNISPLDRSNLADGARLEQADGTAWMAYYAMSMLVIAVELAQENPVYDDMVVKFLEQFLQIRRALERQGLYDDDDAFFYDRLVYPSGESTAVKVRIDRGPHPTAARRRPTAPAGSARQPAREGVCPGPGTPGPGRAAHDAGLIRELDGRQNVLVSVLHPDDVRVALREFLDEAAFLSPHGLRSVSKRYQGHPYSIPGMPGATIDYEPAESTTSMFGGNSNWRGPVWMPLNYLAIRQFVLWQNVPRRRLHPRVPDRLWRSSGPSGRSRRTSPTASSPSGCRTTVGGDPSSARSRRLQEDPAWKDNLFFFEYFHGDDGAGLGAMHQTGWTALVVDLLLDPPGGSARALTPRHPRRAAAQPEPN